MSLLAWIRTFGSLTILLVPLLVYSPPLKPIRKICSSYTSDFVTLLSVIPAEPTTDAESEKAREYRIRVWQQAVLVGLAVVETGAWTAVVASEAMRVTAREKDVTGIILPAGMAFVWVNRPYLWKLYLA